MLEDNDILRLVSAFDSKLDEKLDKKFKEQEEMLDLKLQAKGMVWAEKTINDILKKLGIDIEEYKEVQADMAFVRWFRKLCTNSLTKIIMFIGGIWGVAAGVSYLRSKGFHITKG